MRNVFKDPPVLWDTFYSKINQNVTRNALRGITIWQVIELVTKMVVKLINLKGSIIIAIKNAQPDT